MSFNWLEGERSRGDEFEKGGITCEGIISLLTEKSSKSSSKSLSQGPRGVGRGGYSLRAIAHISYMGYVRPERVGFFSRFGHKSGIDIS